VTPENVAVRLCEVRCGQWDTMIIAIEFSCIEDLTGTQLVRNFESD
jgi:hypothetical protein